MNPDQPTIQKSYGEWRTFYPPMTEEIEESYWNAVELMDTNPKKSEQLFKKVISTCGNGHLDAILHLGLLYNDTNRTIEGNALITKAYHLATQAFPKDFNFDEDQLIWPDLPNRPILRSLQSYGLELMKEQKFEEAIEEFDRILRLNPGDNQGVRYLILDCLLNLGYYQQAIELVDNWGDCSVEFMYGKMLAYYLLNDLEKAGHQLSIAKEQFPHVAKELTKTRHIFPNDEFDFPTGIDGYAYPVGSKQEAYEYWRNNQELYKRAEGIKQFIKQAAANKR